MSEISGSPVPYGLHSAPSTRRYIPSLRPDSWSYPKKSFDGLSADKDYERLKSMWLPIAEIYADLKAIHREMTAAGLHVGLQPLETYLGSFRDWRDGEGLRYLALTGKGDKLAARRGILEGWLTSAERDSDCLRKAGILRLPSINAMTAIVLQSYNGIPTAEGLAAYQIILAQDTLMDPDDRHSRVKEIERLLDHMKVLQIWEEMMTNPMYPAEFTVLPSGPSLDDILLKQPSPPSSPILIAQDATINYFVHIDKSGAGSKVTTLLDEISRLHLEPLDDHEVEELFHLQASTNTELPPIGTAQSLTSAGTPTNRTSRIRAHSHWLLRPIIHMVDGYTETPSADSEVDSVMSATSGSSHVSIAGHAEDHAMMRRILIPKAMTDGTDSVEEVRDAVSAHLQALQVDYIASLENEEGIRVASKFLEDLQAVLPTPTSIDAESEAHEGYKRGVAFHRRFGYTGESLDLGAERELTDDEFFWREHDWLNKQLLHSGFNWHGQRPPDVTKLSRERILFMMGREEVRSLA